MLLIFYFVMQTGSSFKITSGTSVYDITRDLSRCTCRFFANYRLPCLHMLFVCVEENFNISSNCYDACWNQCFSNNEDSFEVFHNELSKCFYHVFLFLFLLGS